jgi:DNA topoisomerase VI subunit B
MPLPYPPSSAGVKQTRGKFGLGAKMALIWSKMTTGLPFTITSALQRQDFRSRYILDIDIHKNEPNVHNEARLANADGWHGRLATARAGPGAGRWGA